MNKANQKKLEALGMPFGTASGRLRKSILFSLIVQLKQNFCYRCEQEIISECDLSIEHKEPWLQAKDPVESFFNLNNIAFSHLSCNVAAASKPNKKWKTEEERKERAATHQRNNWNKLSEVEKKELRRKKYLKYGV